MELTKEYWTNFARGAFESLKDMAGPDTATLQQEAFNCILQYHKQNQPQLGGRCVDNFIQKQDAAGVQAWQASVQTAINAGKQPFEAGKAAAIAAKQAGLDLIGNDGAKAGAVAANVVGMVVGRGRWIKGDNSYTEGGHTLYANRALDETKWMDPGLARMPANELQNHSGYITFVVDRNGNLFFGRGGTSHSDVAQGQPVRSAGMATFKNGQLTEFDLGSGHYTPGAPGLEAAKQALEQNGFSPEGKFKNKFW